MSSSHDHMSMTIVVTQIKVAVLRRAARHPKSMADLCSVVSGQHACSQIQGLAAVPSQLAYCGPLGSLAWWHCPAHGPSVHSSTMRGWAADICNSCLHLCRQPSYLSSMVVEYEKAAMTPTSLHGRGLQPQLHADMQPLSAWSSAATSAHAQQQLRHVSTRQPPSWACSTARRGSSIRCYCSHLKQQQGSGAPGGPPGGSEVLPRGLLGIQWEL